VNRRDFIHSTALGLVAGTFASQLKKAEAQLVPVPLRVHMTGLCAYVPASSPGVPLRVGLVNATYNAALGLHAHPAVLVVARRDFRHNESTLEGSQPTIAQAAYLKLEPINAIAWDLTGKSVKVEGTETVTFSKDLKGVPDMKEVFGEPPLKGSWHENPALISARFDVLGGKVKSESPHKVKHDAQNKRYRFAPVEKTPEVKNRKLTDHVSLTLEGRATYKFCISPLAGGRCEYVTVGNGTNVDCYFLNVGPSRQKDPNVLVHFAALYELYESPPVILARPLPQTTGLPIETADEGEPVYCPGGGF